MAEVPGEAATPRFRVLSMDGGGVYGMFTDLMLKELRTARPGFLDEDCVHLFAGTSAGAVNACILAMHDVPADGLDAAVAFWGEAGVYDNSDPAQFWSSNLGLSPYFGTDDYKAVLKKYFGERTLGDLPHPVLVVTWDWSGEQADAPRPRQWRPKIYCNFPANNPDRAAKLTDVAFQAGAPSWFRCIYRGRQDGGLIAPNPAMYAVTRLVDTLSRARHSDAAAAALPERFKVFAEPEHYGAEGKHFGLRGHLSVLSLGVGAQQPFLPVDYADWGIPNWLGGMWNPYLQRWVSPMGAIALDGPTEAVDDQCDQLLNIPGQPRGFFRLNPRALRTPVMDALVHLRANPYYLDYIKKDIRGAVDTPVTRQALAEARHWLDEAGWCPQGSTLQ